MPYNDFPLPSESKQFHEPLPQHFHRPGNRLDAAGADLLFPAGRRQQGTHRGDIHSDILFWRSLLGCLIVTAFLVRAGSFNKQGLQPQLIGWHALRNVTHFGGQCAWLVAIAALPLAEVFALEFTTPLWAALMAALFMGEALNRGRWVSLLLGFAGVLVILRPGAAVINTASLVMLAGAFGFGITVIVTRKLTQLLRGHSHAFLLVLFYMTAMQGLLSLFFCWGVSYGCRRRAAGCGSSGGSDGTDGALQPDPGAFLCRCLGSDAHGLPAIAIDYGGRLVAVWGECQPVAGVGGRADYCG